ncbi:MAG: ATP-dependent RNA helicase DbpA [Nannocystaceae bacterium]
MTSDFNSLPLSSSLLAVVGELGYGQPTPIQAQCIPALLNRRDVIGHSKTGSGKTAAFALPILQVLRLEQREIQALVVCPTRELCAQVAREIRKLGRRHSGLAVLELVGGQPFRPQAMSLERGVHVAVGTPGRLLDHLTRGTIDTRAVGTVVLDEADRMLDMGFDTDVKQILGALPPSRQTVLFSATFPDSIEAMSRACQRDPLKITIGDGEHVAEIRQLALPSHDARKVDSLYWIFREYRHVSVLVFCNFKTTVAQLHDTLVHAGFSVDCLHGDLEQFDRDQVLARFRNHSVRILIATDVVGRGIDLDDLDLVINYELPPQPEIYIHRIGRTGRAGKLGVAIALLGKGDTRKLGAIEALMGEKVERVPELGHGECGIDGRTLAREATMATILISGGRKDKIRPGDILGALTGAAGGFDSADIGTIEIHPRLSYVAVSQGIRHEAVQCLNAGRIKAKRFRASLVGRKRGGHERGTT